MSGTILITVDSLRKDYMSYGQTNSFNMPKTKEFFDKEYNNAYATYPSTIGSFQSILGGIYPDSIGLDKGQNVSTQIKSDIKIGISTNVLTSEKYGYDDGYNSFNSFADDGINNYIGRLLPEGSIYNFASKSWGIFLNIKYTIKSPDREFPRTTEVISKLKDELDKNNESWFAWVHLMDTHHPFHSEIYSDLTRSEAYKITKKVMGQNGGTKREEDITRKLYQDTIKQLDDDLEELWNYLDDTDKVILCGDHGEHFGTNNHWGHHKYLDDELLNIPFMTKNIKIPETNVISLIDVPSILLQRDWNQGKYGGREFAYALCDENKAITDGDTILTTSDNYDDADQRLVRKLEIFNPKHVVSQDEALNEDLEALGYL